MANKNPKTDHLTSWKPGQTGNPKGSSKAVREEGLIRRLTTDELKDIYALITNRSVDELKAMLADGKTTVLKAMVAGVAVRAMTKGDGGALETLLARMIGKVKENIHHTGDAPAAQVVFMLPDNGKSAK
ncbi:MAG: DUF5681 domain-containing protein [Chlamydiales bacterium]